MTENTKGVMFALLVISALLICVFIILKVVNVL